MIATFIPRCPPHERLAKRRSIGQGTRTATATLVLWAMALSPGIAEVLFEATSPYHHVRVIEERGLRTLCFDDATETQMSVSDPLAGHFEYTEYFHMPWLWNTNLQRVLMIGLGGGSAQHAFAAYYPAVTVETVEIDPMVVRVAREFFRFEESARQKVHVEDGRVFLRRSTAQYDLVILDAYVTGRYGSSIPQHLATEEFFKLAADHLSTNGVLAYNVIGTLSGWHADIVGAIYRTLKTVFPQVYLFPASSSQNVVLLATKAGIRAQLPALRQRAMELIQSQRTTLPAFRQRLEHFQSTTPASVARSPVLTDDYAPVEGLAAAGH